MIKFPEFDFLQYDPYISISASKNRSGYKDTAIEYFQVSFSLAH